MKKVIISALIAFLTAISVSAQSYRGYGTLGLALCKGDKGCTPGFNLSTTHGIQLNPHFFVGAGGEYFYCEIDNSHNETSVTFVGVYGTIRYDLALTRKCSPFVSVDLGGRVWSDLDADSFHSYNNNNTGTTDISKFLFNLNFGVRIKTGHRTGVTLGFKYTPFKINGSCQIRNGDYYSDNYKEVIDAHTYSVSAFAMAFLVGFEF